MKKRGNLEKLSKNGIQFFDVEYLIEIFPAPISEQINDVEIISESDLFRMSPHEGFFELFLPSTETILGESKGKQYEFSRFDFLKWQLSRFNNTTIYYLINKTAFSIFDVVDEDEEYEKNPDFDPDSWLNTVESDEENFNNGILLIERLKKEYSDIFYSTLIDSIIDSEYGVLEFLETEIDENLEEVRSLYSEWNQPIMIVSKGKFLPYIESEFSPHLMMDDFRLQRMFVRNNDEGEI